MILTPSGSAPTSTSKRFFWKLSTAAGLGFRPLEPQGNRGRVDVDLETRLDHANQGLELLVVRGALLAELLAHGVEQLAMRLPHAVPAVDELGLRDDGDDVVAGQDLLLVLFGGLFALIAGLGECAIGVAAQGLGARDQDARLGLVGAGREHGGKHRQD
jgi:hypothetical protein